ncbi:hypothetical protein E4T56_gene17899 [Termitomyces sp. T112]|nr:hypothetical protein E4T56_gene17899 [Termitomyces sp. T112]
MQKNIWIAAADGDLGRVQHLVDVDALDPNVPDEHTYTPMHAAASYAQLDVLAFLIARGGNVDITDDDGDTPLYTVEDIPTARFLVQHGATIDRRNAHGLSPIDHLAEDFPDVAAYLQSLLQPPTPHNAQAEPVSSVADIMQRAEAEGRDPEDELRAAVSRTVAQGLIAGDQLTTDHVA